MITNNILFNDDTLNIFTDASIAELGEGEYIGCSGAHVCTGSNPTIKVLEQPRVVLMNTTNNNAEATAVLVGIQAALRYRHLFKYINLISDSKITIYGIREWIFKWTQNAVNGILYSSSGDEVKNQDILLQIIYTILDTNLCINLYNQRGHINICNKNDLEKAKKYFITANMIRNDIDMELIKNISIANDMVDKFTRKEINDVYLNLSQYPERTDNLIKFFYDPFDIDRYRKLINK